MAKFQEVVAVREDPAIRLRFRLDEPRVLGWQVFDPATGAFLSEGQWPEPRGPLVDLSVSLPEQDGPYRVHVAPIEDRERFILIEARVSGGSVEVGSPRIASRGGLRRAGLMRAIPKAFIYPVRSLWSNRKLMVSMVRRDILARYRGSFGGALWTFLNPLLLMATYAYVFGAVLHTRFAGDSSGLGYVFYFLTGMLPWLALSEAVGRSPYVILEHRNFVKKLVFPLETLPANLVISGAV